MKISWATIFVLLFLYRCAYSFLAQMFIINITTLGDARRYQGRATLAFGESIFHDSTAMTDTLGRIFQTLTAGDPIGVNLCFQAVAFIGICRLLLVVDADVRSKLLFLLMLPSFTLWSSIASKEAVVVYGMCFLSAYLIKLYRDEYQFNILHLFPAYIVFLFKKHYFAALLFVFATILIAKHVRQKAFLAICLGLFSVTWIWVFRDLIDNLAFEVQIHFLGEGAIGRSSRPEFWIETYDVFRKAPEGMLLSFLGPTWSEASTSILHIASLLESGAISVLLMYYLVRRMPEIPVFAFAIAAFTLFWLLFANYPFGVMNPGTAIRYRTGYIVLVFVVFSIFLSRESFTRWTRTKLRARSAAVP